MTPPHSRHRASFAILRIAALSAQEAYDLADYTSSDAFGSRSSYSANNLLDRDYFISDAQIVRELDIENVLLSYEYKNHCI